MPGLEGTSLGRYHLKQRLGRGGMSEVYLAHDGLMNRDVAIKVVSSSYSDYLERFHREAEAIGRLRHNHILPAFDYGEQEPWHYLVMPHIEGGTLRDLLENGRLSLEHAGELFQQIADGLQYAHDHGIIHRDIKPSNILLRDDHYAYLADFGLAKSLEGTSGLTQTGTLLGTPEYMAPELSEGPATTSSDIYALGIVLYQMVTGRVPFSGDTPMAIYWKQLREQPLPPSRLVPNLPRSVEQVILRALDKDPRTRYHRATDLMHAFLQALHSPVHRQFQEAPPAYESSVMDDNLAAFDMPPPRAGVNPALGPTLHKHEDRLVLPANPLDAPSAIPAARNRAGLRNVGGGLARARTTSMKLQGRMLKTFRGRTGNSGNVGAMGGKRVAPGQEGQAYAATHHNRSPVEPMPLPPLEPLQPASYAGDHSSNVGAGLVPARASYPITSADAHPRPQNVGAGLVPARVRYHRQRRRRNPVIVAAVVAAIFFLVIAGLIGLSSFYYHASGQADRDAAATARASATAQASANNATATAIVQATRQTQASTALNGTPVLTDPLSSNTGKRWPEANATCGFINGSYSVLANSARLLQPCISNMLSYDNAAVQVDVTLLTANDAGVIIRANGEQFYTFEINNQGQFFFRRHDTGGGSNFTMLVPLTTSSIIAPVGQKNTLLVIAHDNDFKLYINQTFVAETQDSSYASGEIGFAAGTLAQQAAGEANFSQLNVYKA